VYSKHTDLAVESPRLSGVKISRRRRIAAFQVSSVFYKVASFSILFVLKLWS
jgi:hypothetical protein